jgi:hypothetical protein
MSNKTYMSLSKNDETIKTIVDQKREMRIWECDEWGGVSEREQWRWIINVNWIAFESKKRKKKWNLSYFDVRHWMKMFVWKNILHSDSCQNMKFVFEMRWWNNREIFVVLKKIIVQRHFKIRRQWQTKF